MAGLRFNIFAVDKTRQAFQSVKNNVRGVKAQFKGLKSSIKGMGAAIAAAFAGAAIRNVVNATDEIQKFSIRLGITTEQLSQLKFAGEQTGVSFNQLSLGIQRMTRRVSEAAQGMGEAQGALAELGLDAAELNAMSPDQQFNKVADALNGVTNQADKVRLAFKLFDSEGVALIQTMEGGSQAVERLKNELKELGGEVSERQANQLAALNDSWNRMTTAIEGVVRNVVELFGPAVEFLLDKLALLFAAIGKIVKAFTFMRDSIAAFSIRVQELFGVIDEAVADEAIRELASQWGEVKKGADDTKAATDKLNKALDETAAKMDEINKKGKGGSNPKRGKGGEKAPGEDKMTEGEKQAERTMERIEDTFKDGITNVIRDFDNLGDVVKDTMSRIGDIILQNQMDQIFGGLGGSGGGGILGGITDIFGGMLGGGGGSGGGGFDLFGSIASAFSGGFGGFFANGGAFKGGKPIVVGEKGPELIMPRTGGQVVPNHKMGGDNINVVMNISTPDANSFRQSQAQFATEMSNQIEIAKRRNM